MSYSWTGSQRPHSSFQLGTAPVDKHRGNCTAQTLGDVKDLLLRQMIGHRQIPFCQVAAWLHSGPLLRLSHWLRFLSIRQKWCRESIMALLCSVTACWKPLSYQTWSSEPRKTSGSCYCCDISQQGALTVADVQGFTPHLKKNISHIVEA